MANYDFGGYATRFNVKCSDGRTIKPDAFKDQDGQRVTLVWQHVHDDKSQVLGHADMEWREDGMYAYGSFNNNQAGQEAKEFVMHGDVDALSIYANKLQHNGRDVIHGKIREVSLVMAGANPGAYIDTLSFAHSDDPYDADEAIITPLATDYIDVLAHAESEEEEKKEMADERTVKDVYDEMTEEQKKVVALLVGMAAEGETPDEGEDEDMRHNVFDQEEEYMMSDSLTHDDFEEIMRAAKRTGSLKEGFEECGFLAHAEQEYGVENLSYLNPDYTMIGNQPEFIKRDTTWVSDVMSGVHHSPFSRIKSIFADITEDEARAKGYVKGNLKKEEVFKLLKRTTDPGTVYKKQKLDRDDVIDITSLDIIAYIKSEMRMMLDEELARAFLVGDGRSSLDADKINESHIRPIWTDSDLFTIKATVPAAADENAQAKAFIRTAIKNRKQYKGSGNPVLFTTEDMLTDMLLLEDKNERVIYDTMDKLATALRVRKIITVPVMEGLKRKTDDGKDMELLGIVVNLTDYNVGADKGGAVNMFDDFDIDYNQMKYLIETRCSGALTKPYSAMVLEKEVTA